MIACLVVIARVHLKRFRAFEVLDLALPRMTLLVGPNGSGKSTILEALDCVGRLGERPAAVVFSGSWASSRSSSGRSPAWAW